MTRLFALVFDDLVIGFSEGDIASASAIEVPEGMTGLPAGRLRVSDGAIVDIAAYGAFFVDAAGVKHIGGGEGRTSVSCSWDDRLTLVDGAWHVISASDRLSEIKAALCLEVDNEAERERLRYITAGAGQAMVYQRKGEEARRFVAWRADHSEPAAPDAGTFPILEASIGVEGASLDDVASLVIATEDAWVAVAARIERARLSGKAAIDAAMTEAAVRSARAAVVWN